MSQSFVRENIEKFNVNPRKNRGLYVLPLIQFLKLQPKAWSRQRPVDEARVEEIYESILSTGNIDGLLMMAWHPKERMIVYDGQHRFAAIERLDLEKDYNIVVDILWSASEEKIAEEFYRINKSVPVAELYLTPIIEDDVKIEIEMFVKDLSRKYPDFVKTARKPNRPNFNRDNLTDELFHLWKNEFPTVEFSKISSAILKLNEKYHTDLGSHARVSMRKNKASYEKCHANGFWLFAVDGHIDPHLVGLYIE